jgi:hypothetical protein
MFVPVNRVAAAAGTTLTLLTTLWNDHQNLSRNLPQRGEGGARGVG